MIIRPIAEIDLPDVVKLIHTTIKYCYPDIYPSSVVDFFLKYHSLQALKKRYKSGNLFVGESEGAFLATGFVDNEELGGVYVHVKHQNSGLGSDMVKYLLDFAEEKCIERLWLDSTPLAKKLYLNFGFRVVENKTDLMADGSPLEYLYMEKNLN